VESEARLRFELALCLGGKYNVAAVASAGEALDLVALGAFFDVVLCELRLPEMNGVELCRHLAEIESALASRVVLMSDGVPDAPLRHALQALPNPCITRPFEGEVLLAVLEGCMARSRALERAEAAAAAERQRARPDAASVFALAVRLLRGERLDLVDDRGRPWSASATTLALLAPDGPGETAVTEGCAADIALEIVRRRLRS
jgi:CheY-like chemotaxis protein